MDFGGIRELESLAPGFLKRDTEKYLEENNISASLLAILTGARLLEQEVGKCMFDLQAPGAS